MTSRFIVAAFALLFLPVPAVGEEHPSLRSECRRLLSSYFNGSFFGRQALLEDIKPLRPYYKEGGTRKRGDYEYTYLPTITVQVTQQQMRDPKAVASLAVLGAWCLVLGACAVVVKYSAAGAWVRFRDAFSAEWPGGARYSALSGWQLDFSWDKPESINPYLILD